MEATAHRLIPRVLGLAAMAMIGLANVKLLRSVATVLGLAFAGIAPGAAPVWSVEQIYTTADGSIQFAVFSTPESGQQYLAGHTLIARESVEVGGTRHRSSHPPQAFIFPRDLPGDSANRTFLVATQRFADLQLVQPDFIVPNNFFPLRTGIISLAGVEAAGYGSPPTDGLHALQSLGNGWITDIAEPTNFAGEQHTFAGEQWVVGAAKAAASASGTLQLGLPPRWQLIDAYSNPDGSVQFIVVTTPTSGLQFLRGQYLSIGHQLEPLRIYRFASNLPGDSAGHSVLIATRGFANLGVLKPDYVVPDGFFTAGAGPKLMEMARSILVISDPLEWTDTSVATNYAGDSYTFGPGVSLPPPPPSPPPPKPACPWGPWWCRLQSR